jgi:chromate transporter
MLFKLFYTFAKIGLFTFGGGYGMIAIVQDECVEKKKWITEDEFATVLTIAESTPGPIAINCATYTGYAQGGILGSLAATFGVVLPSFVIIFLISSFFDKRSTILS